MPESNEQQQNDPEAKFTQADIDRIVTERLSRQQKQFADYDELKDKASKYDSMASELAELKASNQLADWKSQVSKELGVPIDLLRGATLEEIQAHGESLKPFVTGTPVAPVVPKAGDQPESNDKESPEIELLRDLGLSE